MRSRSALLLRSQYEEDPPWFGTIIIPQAPFGDPKMDNGERWDLKAKARHGAAAPVAAGA